MEFEDFLIMVEPQYQDFARSLHDYLLQNGCKCKISSARQGYLVSYQYGKKKRVLMNFVFRKSGLVARIYSDHIAKHMDFLESLPDNMKKIIEKAPTCKRFEDPPKCTPKCGGYLFSFNGSDHKKCRYSCFLFEVNNESIPFIRTMVEKELKYRTEQ